MGGGEEEEVDFDDPKIFPRFTYRKNRSFEKQSDLFLNSRYACSDFA